MKLITLNSHSIIEPDYEEKLLGFCGVVPVSYTHLRAGWRLPGRRRRAVHTELHHWWSHRGLCSGVAPAGGGMVCAPHHLPTDRGALKWNNGIGKPAGINQPAFLMVSAPE